MPSSSDPQTGDDQVIERSATSRDAAPWIILVATTYFPAGKLGLALAFVNASPSAVWPPTGIAAGLPSPMVSAVAGIRSLTVAGYAAWPTYGSIWLTWWLPG